MRKQIEVKLDFINKKGQLKHVKFYMDKQTYEMLFDKSISEEVRHQYLVDEYHEYERERYYRRKFISLNNDLVEELEVNVECLKSDVEHQESTVESLLKAIGKLTPRQQEIIKLIYWEGKSQKELCEIYCVKKQAISDAVKRIRVSLKKILEKDVLNQ